MLQAVFVIMYVTSSLCNNVFPKNGQTRETVNIGYTRQTMKTNKITKKNHHKKKQTQHETKTIKTYNRTKCQTPL
jgi:hypothetical protein